MPPEIVKRTYTRLPSRSRLSRLQVLRRAVVGALLSPTYWVLAHRFRTPGLWSRVDCALLALRLLCDRKAPFPYPDIYRLLFWPLDSVRYFEYDFMWQRLSELPVRSYLDVSSPRLFPIILMMKKRGLFAELINPDASDLAFTANLVKALGLDDRCHLHGCLISAAPFEAESFDVVTSMSVVEHIPQDTQAVQKMWELLKPSGRLILTVPCAAETSEQFINQNLYSLLEPDEQGFIFFQRFYDARALAERIYPVTGQPRRYAVYGERTPGTLRRNADQKWAGCNYPYWREPYMMGREFCYFKSTADMPGEGVIALEFQKA